MHFTRSEWTPNCRQGSGQPLPLVLQGMRRGASIHSLPETSGAGCWWRATPGERSVRPIIHDMLKHLCSAISYGGATSLADLREKFWAQPESYLIRLSQASRVESFDR